MRQKFHATDLSSEEVVKDISRATRKRYSAEEKIRIVSDGLRGEHSIAELCLTIYRRLEALHDDERQRFHRHAQSRPASLGARREHNFYSGSAELHNVEAAAEASQELAGREGRTLQNG
jgi:transposase-like protein